MNRRKLISVLTVGALSQTMASAKDAPKKEPDGAPRWKFLGDDDSLRETIRECSQVLLICVYQTSLEDVKPPFAMVVFHATVVQSVKGAHKLGDRISIRFVTDRLPSDEAERSKFIADRAAKNAGALRMAFIRDGKDGVYSCEWLDVPTYEPAMLDFAMKNRK
jgi:hypothetical protein